METEFRINYKIKVNYFPQTTILDVDFDGKTSKTKIRARVTCDELEIILDAHPAVLELGLTDQHGDSGRISLQNIIAIDNLIHGLINRNLKLFPKIVISLKTKIIRNKK